MVAALQRIPVFDGHNDALLRLHQRGGADAAMAFLDGEDKGQLDLVKARRGGFAGGLSCNLCPLRPAAQTAPPTRQQDLTLPRHPHRRA